MEYVASQTRTDKGLADICTANPTTAHLGGRRAIGAEKKTVEAEVVAG